MDAARKARLQAGGIEVDSALERMMGSEALLERFLGKFLADPNYDRLCRAVADRDEAAALTAAHTLKGVCGNLSMTALFETLTAQVAEFRAGDWAAAAGRMPTVTRAYQQAVRAIRGED